MGSAVSSIGGMAQGVLGQVTGTGSNSGILGLGQYHTDPTSVNGQAFAPDKDEQAYLKMVQDQAAGKGPSVAQGQMEAGIDASGAQAQALAASQRGVSPALAARMAAQGQASMAQNAAFQGSQLRAGEQLNAMGQLGQEVNSIRQGREGLENLNSGNANYAMGTNAQAYEGSAQRRSNFAGGLMQGMGGMMGGKGAYGGMVPGYHDVMTHFAKAHGIEGYRQGLIDGQQTALIPQRLAGGGMVDASDPTSFNTTRMPDMSPFGRHQDQMHQQKMADGGMMLPSMDPGSFNKTGPVVQISTQQTNPWAGKGGSKTKKPNGLNPDGSISTTDSGYGSSTAGGQSAMAGGPGDSEGMPASFTMAAARGGMAPNYCSGGMAYAEGGNVDDPPTPSTPEQQPAPTPNAAAAPVSVNVQAAPTEPAPGENPVKDETPIEPIAPVTALPISDSGNMNKTGNVASIQTQQNNPWASKGGGGGGGGGGMSSIMQMAPMIAAMLAEGGEVQPAPSSKAVKKFLDSISQVKQPLAPGQRDMKPFQNKSQEVPAPKKQQGHASVLEALKSVHDRMGKIEQQLAKGGPVTMKSGGPVPGKAKVNTAKNTYDNDTVPAKLSPGEIVIPRSVTMGPDPINNSAKFVATVLARKRLGKG